MSDEKDFLERAERFAEAAEHAEEKPDPLQLAQVYAILAIAQRVGTIAERTPLAPAVGRPTH